MTFAAVHQFHSGAAPGDAITDQMLHLQLLLRRAGFVSNVYAEHIANELSNRISPIENLEQRPSSVLLVHHSIGHTAFDVIERLNIPLITIYHSITPAKFYDNPWLQARIALGQKQLRKLAFASCDGIADSNHNRREMYDAGFTRVTVIPVRTDFDDFRAIDRRLRRDSRDWLFVGRVVPNKNQALLVAAFGHYRKTWAEGHLNLVGDDSYEPYVAHVRDEIMRLGLSAHVTLHGKVSATDLCDHYASAGVFVCVSEHEGFGVPLLEAMAAGLPVVAWNEAAVAETMGGAGLTLESRDVVSTAAAVRVVLDDDDLRSRVVDNQDRRLLRVEEFDTIGALDAALMVAEGVATARPTLQVQGPFETSYSLATLNRELALALTRDFDVSLYPTEGPGDYLPDPADLHAHPAAAQLYERAPSTPFPDIAIRQMYPPRVHDSVAGMTFQYFGWEESRIPSEFVQQFNQHLDGVGVMSTYVHDVLRSEGVVVPIAVVGVGVHQPSKSNRGRLPVVPVSDKHTFLHISSAFPRKGVDVLLRAYFEVFTDADDVRLVLKTFPNPHNNISPLLDALRREFTQHPEVVWLDHDMDREQLDSLYGIADTYVHPARGEGFGLPVAEAMLAKVPVISTAAGGLADFVRPQTAAVITHTLAPARTHLTQPGSVWAEPSLHDLRNEMRLAVGEPQSAARLSRADAACDLVSVRFSWDAVADRWSAFLQQQRNLRSGISLAMVTTFNSRCGIAEYSAQLSSALGTWIELEVLADRGAVAEDPHKETTVRRVWDNFRSGGVDNLLAALDESTADVTHIQYNFGFFALENLAQIIRHETTRRPTMLTLHRTAPLVSELGRDSLEEIAAELHMCDSIIVHQRSDRDYLRQIGVVDNVQVLPIGSPPLRVSLAPTASKRQKRHSFQVGTYGFLLPHKGLKHLLEAVAILKSRCIDVGVVACCAIHPDPSSAALLDEVRTQIDSLGLADDVELHPEYLSEVESLDLLSVVDVMVLPYDPTSESSSAAIRSILPLACPVITSDISIFRDVSEVVQQISSPVSPLELANELERLWLDPKSQQRAREAVIRYVSSTSWPHVARMTRDLYSAALSSPGRRHRGSVR